MSGWDRTNCTNDTIAQVAVGLADALIAELKGGKE